MKTKLIFFGLLCFKLSFGQNSLSLGSVNALIPVAPNEIFRFQPGNVTQLDAGTNFNLNISNGPVSSRWFSLGGVGTGPGRRAYGLRFQAGEKAVTFGYQNVNDLFNINPRIEWIGTGASLGNLEFRVADSFTSTVSTLVATMTKDGNTIFGQPSNITNSKVAMFHTNPIGLEIISSGLSSVSTTGLRVEQTSGFPRNIGGTFITSSANFAKSNTGLLIQTQGRNVIGVDSDVSNVTGNIAIGVRGFTSSQLNIFQAGIYGQATFTNGNQWAGYFDGEVFATGNFNTPFNSNFRTSAKKDTNVLDKLKKLQPISFTFSDETSINLPKGLQHGFNEEELVTVFPELIKDVVKPVFDKDGSVTSNVSLKSFNYNGLISILTAGIQELNEKVTKLESQLADRNEKSSLKTANVLIENTKAAFMEQNIPNPFSDQATIRYQLPESTTTAEIMVFDLNGRLIKNYPVNNNQTEITIKASEIGSGLFIYSLVQNGQELLTKKMIIKS